MFETIMYIVFGLQFMLAACFFVHNRRKLKAVPLYNEIRSRISLIWHLLPISMCCGVCLLCTIYARYMYSSVLLCLLLLPFFWIHLANEPIVLRRSVTEAEIQYGSFRNVMLLGGRSRVLLMAVTANLLLLWNVFICA